MCSYYCIFFHSKHVRIDSKKKEHILLIFTTLAVLKDHLNYIVNLTNSFFIIVLF
uniref:Uncharacterized protein n=1 Tax=Arundo donax TaxID=35708 RepID=A0A0A9FEZ7_ARUDO